MYKQHTDSIYILGYLFSGIFKASNTDYNTDVSIDFPVIGYLSIDYSHSALRYKWELSIWAFIKFKKIYIFNLKQSSHKPYNNVILATCAL